MKVTVSGVSDDIICLEGDISDEVYDPYLGFDDGTIIKAEYSPKGYFGKWKIERVKEGLANYSHRAATNDEDDYSDVVTLTGNFSRFDNWF